MRCSMDALLEARVRLNEALEETSDGVKLSLNDFILKATAMALREVPAANVSFAEDAIRFYERVDLSVAVATEGGLVTPIVRDADRKGLAQLAVETKELVALARAGKLRPEQFQGGTFTVSNLGMYGIETVYPILNPPQAGILGVGAVEAQPIVRAGEVVVGRMAAFTLAADHRVVDGAIGAQLMAALRSRIEDPAGMLL
jgi:pyruvate dehydrogenase E2 component (dihydrolipoamide acetyltransferase)